MLLFAALAALHVPSAGWKRTLGRIRLVFTSCNSAWRIASYFVDVYPLYLYFAERRWPPYLLDWILYLLIGLTLIGLGLVKAQALAAGADYRLQRDCPVESST
jgi:hypothetical protein